MKKAKPSEITNENLYDGLIRAFTGGNIGMFSNHISKIWNDNVFISGTIHERQNAIDHIKRLVCQNNMVIDYAKTLYKPEFPDHIKKEITSFTNKPLPHFFKYAKDKTNEQISSVNQSFVNKLDSLIPNPRINCKYIKDHKPYKLDKPDYTLLMNNPDIDVKICKSDNGRLIEGTNPVVLAYIEKAKQFYGKVDAAMSQIVPRLALSQSETRQRALYQQIITDVKTTLSQYGYSEFDIADILTKYLYKIKDSKHKDLLWTCYGDILLDNLLNHKKRSTKDINCIDCGKWFEIKTKDNQTCRCPECSVIHNKNLRKEQNRRAYLQKKISVGHKDNLKIT